MKSDGPYNGKLWRKGKEVPKSNPFWLKMSLKWQFYFIVMWCKFCVWDTTVVALTFCLINVVFICKIRISTSILAMWSFFCYLSFHLVYLFIPMFRFISLTWIHLQQDGFISLMGYFYFLYQVYTP